MSDNPYTDDEYDDTYKNVHGDEPARDQYAGDETTDGLFFPSDGSNSLSSSGWGIWPGVNTGDATAKDTDEEDGWWDEGLIGSVLVAGVVLFLFPEPATSAIGIGLITIGVIAWLADWLA